MKKIKLKKRLKKSVDKDEIKFLNPNKGTKILKRCLIDSTEIEIGKVYFWKVEKEFPVFVFIKRIFNQENKSKLISQIIETKAFDSNLCVFKVNISKKLVDFKFKVHFKPMIIYLSNSNYYIVKNFIFRVNRFNFNN